MFLLLAVITIAMSFIASVGRWADDTRTELRGQHAANSVALALGAGSWSPERLDVLARPWLVSVDSHDTESGITDIVVVHRERHFRATAFAPTLESTHD